MNSGEQSRDLGSTVVDSIDQMVRWPLRLTGATMDLMLQGVQRLGSSSGQHPQNGTSYNTSSYNTRDGGTDYTSMSSTSAPSSSSGSSWTSMFTGDNNRDANAGDQDLSGEDLKFVLWAIVFTKPGFETVLEPQHSDLVNYSADGNSYAAVKIAKFLENARSGRVEKPEIWNERNYPGDQSQQASRRPEAAPMAGNMGANMGGKTENQERGWRIPPEDQRYITFLYHVDRRLPKQQAEVTRVERVTIERGRGNTTAVA